MKTYLFDGLLIGTVGSFKHFLDIELALPLNKNNMDVCKTNQSIKQ